MIVQKDDAQLIPIRRDDRKVVHCMVGALAGCPDDVGRAVSVLAAGDITYATGQVLHIGGGMDIARL